MYLCLYDLEKAFDSVEFSILMKRLFDVSVNSKTRHIYCKIGTLTVKVLYAWVSMYPLPLLWVEGCDRGPSYCRRYSYLVMNSLLRQLQSLSIGVSVNNMYVGGFLHADDICTLASSLCSTDLYHQKVHRRQLSEIEHLQV